MHSVISISVITACLVISLTCGIIMLRKRKEVNDRSRLFLAVFNLFTALLCALRLFTFISQPTLRPYHEVLAPFLMTGGLACMVIYLAYPIEVINPGWFNKRRGLLLALPALMTLALPLCGVNYQHLTSLSDVVSHLTDFDVMVRIAIVGIMIFYTFLLWFIPHNWRESSVDNHWIRRANLFMLIMALLFFTQVFTTLPWSFHIHVTWVCATFVYFTCFELFERLSPSTLPQPSTPIASGDERGNTSLWEQICQVVDEWEAWRNPNTSVETISTAVGTNRIYVARCIKEHTGLTVNDYINQKRVDFIASELKKAPLSHKEIYFAAGYRSRQTAYRNFLKFKGVSPTDFSAAPF
jgi:AraC-like DNA-binding protein